LGSVDKFFIGDRTIKISAGPDVPAVEGKRDFKQSGTGFFRNHCSSEKRNRRSAGSRSQLVSYEVASHLTTLTITFFVFDGSTLKCDDIFWTSSM